MEEHGWKGRHVAELEPVGNGAVMRGLRKSQRLTFDMVVSFTEVGNHRRKRSLGDGRGTEFTLGRNEFEVLVTH